MEQLIYLSRHGTVRANKEKVMLDDPQAYELLEEGITESRNLGTYLKRLPVPNPVVVDSGLARTVASAHLVAESMGITLAMGRNYHSSPALQEQVCWEFLTAEQREEYYCDRNRGKPVWAALLLGRKVHAELCRIGDIYSPRDIIAILHGGINAGLIADITGKLEMMQNCGLYVLERVEDRLKVVSDYISPERMREELESGKIIEKGVD